MNPEKFTEPEAEDKQEKTESIRKEVDETIEEEARLESIREELREFKRKEEAGEIKSCHLLETPSNPGVDVDSLTKKDLKMYERLGSFTVKELSEHRQSINPKDKSSFEFVGFLANAASPRLSQELPKKEKDK